MPQRVKTSSLSPRPAIRGLALALSWTMASCARQPPAGVEDAPGMLSGFLHGLIALPALVGSLLLEIRVYAFPNSGFWYDLGFCVGFFLGIGVLLLPVIPFIGGFLTRRN